MSSVTARSCDYVAIWRPVTKHYIFHFNLESDRNYELNTILRNVYS